MTVRNKHHTRHFGKGWTVLHLYKIQIDHCMSGEVNATRVADELKCFWHSYVGRLLGNKSKYNQSAAYQPSSQKNKSVKDLK